METENQSKPMSGCLKVVMIAASVFVILFIIAYFAVWRVPYNQEEVKKVSGEVDGKIAFYRSIPPENNGWSDYKKVLDGIDFKDPVNPNSSLRYDISQYIHTGIPKEKVANVDEFLENNKDKLKDVDSGFKKNYVIDDVFLTGDFRSLGLSTQKIEPVAGFLILCGDRNTDLREVSKRYLQALHLTSNTAENLACNRSLSALTALRRIRYLLNSRDTDKSTGRYLVSQLERLSHQRTGLADKMRMSSRKIEGITKSLRSISAGPLSPILLIYINRDIQILEMLYVRLVNAFDKSELEGFKEFNNLKPPILSTSFDYVISSLKDDFKNFAVEESYSKGLVIAAALKLYKAEKGKYPENIEALVPKYLKSLPYDDFSIDRKFTYLGRGQGNVILYSLGIDGKDDGGKDFDFDRGTGDIVILDTQSPPSPEILTGNLQPLWVEENKMKKDAKGKGEGKKVRDIVIPINL